MPRTQLQQHLYETATPAQKNWLNDSADTAIASGPCGVRIGDKQFRRIADAHEFLRDGGSADQTPNGWYLDRGLFGAFMVRGN